MDGLIGLGGTLMLLSAAGVILWIANPGGCSWRWFLVAASLVAINDALLTSLYGLLPDVIGGDRNWQGKLLALAATLAIAALPAFGYRRLGLTLQQEPGSLAAAWPVAIVYCAFFALLALAFPAGQASGEEVAFQLTMPGLEEELFYRGLLLYALGQAFTGRVCFLGVDWGWGAIVSCALFGLTHAFGFSRGDFAFDPVVMALTAIPAFIAIWLRLRTGSVALPVALHNFGNAISLIV